MAKHLLTDRHVRSARAHTKPYRLADGDGLFLYVAPSGVKSWQFRYRHGGKQQTATLGKLDSVGLAQARTEAGRVRGIAAGGRHVTTERRVERAQRQAATSATFAKVRDDWIADEAKRQKWTDDYRQEVEASLDNHLSKLDALPMEAISARVCSPHIRRVEKSAPDMARKVRQRLRGILDHAVERGLIVGNPLPAVRKGSKIERKHLPAVLDKEGVGEILRAAAKAEACKGVQRAHLLCAFTAQRIGEIVAAEWSEFNLTAGTWAIPRARMKRKDKERGPHLVPLPPHLLALLKQWHRADGTGAVYACPAPRGGGPITREAVEKFYRRTLGLSGQHGPHGWRSVFSTWSYDAGDDRDSIEAQFDHVTGGKVQLSYDRGQRIELRHKLMELHEDRLLAARDGAQVVDISERRA